MSSSSSVGSPEIPPLGHAIGGALGSALALLLFYPLERARIEMQADAATRNTDDERTFTNCFRLFLGILGILCRT